MTTETDLPAKRVVASPLFGGPRTLYRGTNLDGAILEPTEGLWVRGVDLNTLIGSVDFPTAILHLWQGRLPLQAERDALAAMLDAMALAMQSARPGCEAARIAARSGASMIPAAACGFLADMRAIECQATASDALAITDDLRQGLVAIAAAPYLLHAALDQTAPTHGSRVPHAARCLSLMNARVQGPTAEHVVDALLVAWHAGFGYVTPTVLVPRTAIGTGVPLLQAVAAGFLAGGPNHVGAGELAMRWLRDMSTRSDAQVRAAVDRTLDDKRTVLSGFGHPLFVQDPRPPHLRDLCTRWGFGGRNLDLYDLVCEHALQRSGLRPNIDFMTAAALLDLGVDEPRWAVGLGLSARVAAMVAHALERRDRPPFGVNSSAARKLLAAVPVGWL